jgi:hypothetical protein
MAEPPFKPIGFPLGQLVPAEPADHAEDFAHRYAEDLDLVTGQVMVDLGIRNDQMGARDPDRSREHHVFFPRDRSGGSVSPAGQITVDSGEMNPALLNAAFDENRQKLWRQTKLRPRIEAIVAHELAEHEYGDHEPALIAGAETKLPVSHAATALLRQMERGWISR